MAAFVLIALMVSSLVAACRRMKNNFRDSEERYRTLVETASDAIIIADECGLILFANPLAVAIFGARTDQIVSGNLSVFFQDSAWVSRLAEMKQRLDTRQRTKKFQLTGRHANGREIPLEVTFGSFSKHGKSVITAFIRESPERNLSQKGDSRIVAMHATSELAPAREAA